MGMKGLMYNHPCCCHSGLTTNEILAQSLLFFIAGYETTATAMSFLAYNLATNQECQEKLYQEILENCGDQVSVSV